MTRLDARIATLSTAVLLGSLVTATAGSLGGPLQLQDAGSFFVGGQTIQSADLGTGPAGRRRLGRSPPG